MDVSTSVDAMLPGEAIADGSVVSERGGQMRTWLRRGVVTLAASAALAGGMVALGASPAAAAVAKKDCTYAGQTYSHGAIIVVSEGLMQQCDDGVWKVYKP